MIVALTGGIGGAKLALGLSRVLPPGELTLAVNTGDDFEHLGLAISPDIDTLMYTLAGRENPQTGWGCRDETWQFMSALESLGGDTWFRLGDRDLATHVERTRRLRGGESLSAVTADFCARLGIGCRVLPMSDDPVRTRVGIRPGGDGDEVLWLDFQDYFVRSRCEPAVAAIRFEGAATARPLPALLAALADPALRAVVVCPSNPWLSIDPMLALPALRAALAHCTAPVVAVSPIIAGRAVKGPTAKIMTELGVEPSAAAVARHYGALIDAFVVDEGDGADLADGAGPVEGGPAVFARRTLMTSLADREALARTVVDIAAAATASPRRLLPRQWLSR
jgi:LPPG:FO 2-phospho-L-lactate transferase